MEKVDYSATLNLPKSDYPMRANLPTSEPFCLEKWYSEDLYHKLLEDREGWSYPQQDSQGSCCEI